ncbi:PA2778 family cysteine peptidase [Marinobacterium mangrovicola]|uniref:Peptidase C39-like protein n=1 Tax=Marinobacterium mangrovicola TaxID=1476959 RepID=A0A4R1GM42_9GAMM|nr:PA2778 family cysteine peptidase [Marinobacterium mangrovicola]TCK08211.1 peptidase C39-like protein [Marinobacterium mangrovicola]
MYSPISKRSAAPGQSPGRSRFRSIFALCATLLILGGCSATPQTNALLSSPLPEQEPLSAELTEVPFYPQEQYQCGPAALATLLEYSGQQVTPDELVPKVYVPEREGSFQVEMLGATRQYQRIAYPIEPQLEALISAIDAGYPVLVLQNLAMEWYPRWHYAVAIGYDLEDETIILRTGVTERYAADMKVFERTWQRGDYWAMVAVKPGDMPPDADARDYFQAVAAFERPAPETEARTAWQTGLQYWPEDRSLLMGYGNHLYNAGLPAQAGEQYLRVTELYADYAPAFNNLAQTLIDTGKPNEALVYARRAVSLGNDQQAQVYRQTLEQAEDALAD